MIGAKRYVYHGPGGIGPGYIVCTECGAQVRDKSLHDAFHDRLYEMETEGRRYKNPPKVR